MIFANSIPCLAEATDIAFPPTLDKLFVLKFSRDELILPSLRDEPERQNHQAGLSVGSGGNVPVKAATRGTNLLDLPFELRLEIYSHLLRPASSVRSLRTQQRPRGDGDSPEIWTPLLRTCRQIHFEATPVLYSQNRWLAHQTLLTSFPRLRSHFKPVTESSLYPTMRKFYLRVRLDCDPPYDRDTVAKAFSGVDELIIETFQAMHLGCGYGVLTRFEGVRGVKRVRILGQTASFQPYFQWLEKAMKGEVGIEPEPYVETDRVMLMFLGDGGPD